MAKKHLSGAEIIIDSLKKEGVECVFAYPGGAAIPLFDALLDSTIQLILVRHEQSAVHMADGYARATGKPGAVLVTSGPGATNTLTGIYTAHMDSVPIVVISGQTITSQLGKDAFQESDISGMSFACVKHSFLVKNVNELAKVVKESFHIAKTGRPGPVLIDVPKDVSTAPCTAPVDAIIDLPGYSIPEKGDESAIRKAAELLSKAKRPVILAGQGCIISDASKQVTEFAEKLQSPVTNTLLGAGAIAGSNTLSLGMLGMHGTAYANKAVEQCDLIMSIGSRWDDRITGKLDEFCKDAVKIHVDIDPAEIGKVLTPDVSIIGDAKHILEELTPLIIKADTSKWLKQINSWKSKYPLHYKKQGGLKMQHIIDVLHQKTSGEAIVATDVGQHQMWTAQFYTHNAPRCCITSGGAGTMGYGFPALIGAALGNPNRPAIAIVGDGGFQMTLMELATIAREKIPVKVFVMDNKFLGMVRQWQDMFYDKRYSGVDLSDNPDFCKLADAYGIKSLKLKRSADVEKIIDRALDFNEGPVLIHCEVEKEANVFPMIPAGAPYSSMMIEPPKVKLEKPTGST
ncbi:MAG: biosynthetic-type acetolactate synthase large subunit [Fibrobacterales bacterium]